MSRWGTIALAAGTFVAGFATSELIDGPVPVESSPIERPAPRPMEADLEWTFTDAGLDLHGEPSRVPGVITRVPVGLPPIGSSPTGRGVRVAPDEIGELWVWGLRPLAFCTLDDCKPCHGDPNQCGSPPPPTRIASSTEPFVELRICRKCDEEHCVKTPGCNESSVVEPTAETTDDS